MRDTLGTIFTDLDFAELFPERGQPALSAWRLALVTIMQFVEGLSDRLAAEAVRSRIDWKYALSLELTDPGFDFSVLCEFRRRLIDGSTEQMLLNNLRRAFPGTRTTQSSWSLLAVETLRGLYGYNSSMHQSPQYVGVHSQIVPPVFSRSAHPMILRHATVPSGLHIGLGTRCT